MIAIADTELLKQIMVKENDIFTDRGFVVSNLHVQYFRWPEMMHYVRRQ